MSAPGGPTPASRGSWGNSLCTSSANEPAGGQAPVGGVSLSPLKRTRVKYFGDCEPRSLEFDGREREVAGG